MAERYCNFKDDNIVKFVEGDFDRLCDAIDAVHAGLERENAELRQRVAKLDESADSMHDGWVRLPVDADGEPIHVGDGIEIIGGEDGVAVAIELCEDGGWNVSMRPTGWDTPTLFAAESVRHYHAPTVEDVLRDMPGELDEVTALYVGEAIDSDERDRDETRIFAEYAKRLTLAGDAERA